MLQPLLLTAVAAVYLLGLASYFVALAVGRARRGPAGFARELTIYLFAPLPILVAAAIILRAPAPLILSLLSAIFAVVALKPRWPVHRRRVCSRATPARFRILTLNVGGNIGGAEAGRVEQTIGSLDPDVVALQELTPALLMHLRDSLRARYPYSDGGRGAVVFSRLPIRDGARLRFPEGESDGQRVEIAIADRTLTLFNAHITRPGYDLRGRWARLRLLRDFDPSTRDADVALIETQIRSGIGPCVLAGDLNATEWSAPYDLVTRALVDAFRERVRVGGSTYRLRLWRGSWHVPAARIDYVFRSHDLVTLEAHVGPDSGSDHLPVVADLAFR